MNKKNNNDTILLIKKVDFDYETLKTFKAGLKLEGWMVKSIRAKKISSSEGVFIKIVNGQALMMGINIKAMIETNTFSSVSEQPTIKLLLNKSEIEFLQKNQDEKGFSIVLKRLFWEKHLVKADIALVRGLKLYDKRQVSKNKDLKREADMAIKKSRLS